VVAGVRPAVRWMARIVFPILIVVAAWQTWDHVEARRLERAYAAIKPHVLERRPTGNRAPAVQETAGRLYAAAAAAVQDGGAYLPQDSLSAVSVRVRNALVGREAPNTEDRERTREFLRQNDLLLALVERGAALPFTVFPAGTEFSYRTSGVMSAERVAALATLDAIQRDDVSSTARLIYGRLQLLRALSDDTFGGSMKAEMIANAATDMAMVLPGLDAQALTGLNAALGAAYADDDVVHAVAAFAKSRYDFVQEVGRGRSWQYGQLGVLLRPLIAHRVTLSLETSKEVLEVAARPWPERITAMAVIHDKHSIVGNASLPYPLWEIAEGTRLVERLIARGVAASRVARVAIAIEAYRRQQQRLPASLSDLPAFDRDTVTDPFTGQPLRYVPDAEGFALYSVGDNGRDEGGKIAPMSGPNGLLNRGPRLDIGVRVIYRRPG
jgi:hypothetical protein